MDDTSAVVTDSNDVLDLDALDDDVQHWVDLMPEHFETVGGQSIKGEHGDDPFTAYTWPSWCSCNSQSGPWVNYCGC